MAVLRSILTKFGFKVEGGKLVRINQQVGAVKRRLNAATRAARQFRRQLGSTANMLRYAAYAFVGSRIVKAFTTDYAKQADAAIKFARSIGMSTEALQELQHASGISGVEIEELRKGLVTIAKRARDASLGLKTQKEAFAELGVEIKDANGKLKTQDQLMMDVADQFAKMPAGTSKTALAMELFGRSGAKLIPLLNRGRAGIAELRQEARKLGIVVGTEAAKQAEVFNDELRRAGGILIGVRNTIASKILPEITRLLTRFKEWYLEGNNAAVFFEKLKKWSKVAGAVLAGFVSSKVIMGFMALGKAVMFGVTAFRMMAGTGLLAWGTIGLILVAIGGLIALTKDLSQASAAFDGIKTMAADVWGSLKPALIELSNAMIPVLTGLWDIVKPLIPYVADLLVAVIKTFGLMLKMITKTIFIIKELFKTLAAGWKATVGVMAGAASLVGDGWRAVIDGAKAIVGGLKSVWDSTIGAIIKKLKSMFGPFKWLIDGIKSIWDATLGKIINKLDWLLKKYAWLKKVIYGEDIEKKRPKISRVAPWRRKGTPGYKGAGYIPSPKEYQAWQRRLATQGLQQRGVVPFTVRKAREAVGGARASVSVGAVNVNISGTTNMNAPEVRDAVEKGARRALNAAIRETMRDIKPATAQ